jgi:uncharacterized lipoprotein NlpE involved in copper resistance
MKKTLFILLVLSLFIIVGCANRSETVPPVAETPQTSGEESAADLNQDQEAIQEQFTSEEAKMYSLIESENLNGCASLTIPYLAANCKTNILMNQAINSGDKSICNKIEEEYSKETCLSLVVEA